MARLTQLNLISAGLWAAHPSARLAAETKAAAAVAAVAQGEGQHAGPETGAGARIGAS
jgi:hypothetical protein